MKIENEKKPQTIEQAAIEWSGKHAHTAPTLQSACIRSYLAGASEMREQMKPVVVKVKAIQAACPKESWFWKECQLILNIMQ